MTKAKNTKRALLASLLSMMLCMAMLVGSTFAWFTDEVKTGVNKIVAGNLDVGLEYAVLNSDGSIKEWKVADENTSLFDENALWEPGYTQVVYLKVSNLGTLALNYKLSVRVDAEKPGTSYNKKTKNQEQFYLSDYLNFGADVNWNGTAYADRATARAAATSNKLKTTYVKGGMEAGTDAYQYIALVVYMPEETGNVANHISAEWAVPEITLGIDLEAHQRVSEYDSFGNDYDAGAWVDVTEDETSSSKWYEDGQATKNYTIKEAKELVELAEKVNSTEDDFSNATITLSSDIDLLSEEWEPIGKPNAAFKGTFDGNGHTVKNLKISQTTTNSVGLFGVVENAKILHVSVEGAIDVTPAQSDEVYIAGVCGMAYGSTVIEKVTSNVNITANSSSAQMYTSGIANVDGNASSKINDCLNKGNISCTATTKPALAGGITSGLVDTSVVLKNVVNLGTVSVSDVAGAMMCGGIVGFVNNTSANQDMSSWRSLGVKTCGMTSYSGPCKDDSKTAAEMKSSSTYEGYSTDIWNIAENEYPSIK